MKIKGAFTLIELLIVVAIIAILAAIAVPNFIEAQTRSKVGRAMADLRSIATALESYRVDNLNYPDSPGAIDDTERLAKLSTPVAYMSNPLLRDPFKAPGKRSSNDNPNLNYIYAPFTTSYSNRFRQYRDRFTNPIAFPLVNGHAIGANNGADFPGPFAWSLNSYGPDGILQYDNDKFALDPADRSQVYYMPYDATNGTKSKGDIFRFGP